MQWSPLGTYLATVHRQGAAVWGGATAFNRLMRYAHPQVFLEFHFALLFGTLALTLYCFLYLKDHFYLNKLQVKLIDFSPGENYLVTYSSHEPSNPRDANVSAFLCVDCFILRFSGPFPNMYFLFVEGCDKYI